MQPLTGGGLLPSPAALRGWLEQVVADRAAQGHDTAGVAERLAAAPDSLDALAGIADSLAELPLRPDWPHVEPDNLEGIAAESDLDALPRSVVDLDDAVARVRTAFLARVAGCVLGKPFEYDPTLDELRAVLEPAGEWPLTDYVTEATNALLRAPQPQWPECVRERITHVPPDDDLNYTVLATVLLEQHGEGFTADELQALWLLNLPVAATFGPERTQLLKAGLATVTGERLGPAAVRVLNPADEHCGALIRTDAYGYACPGDPARAARLAWRDASTTHRRTGVYAAMWVAAAVAGALAAAPADGLAVAETALGVVPRRSRFAAVVRESLDLVRAADDWEAGYRAVHGRFGAWTHCRVYQEVGTLLVTLRFARDVGHGLGLQVGMGNDTDSFGATAGSLLGALHGPAGFDEAHWIGRFRDDVHLALAMVHERSLSRLALRVADLPRRLAQ